MSRKEILTGLLIALLFGGVLSMFASSWPDGLESVAEQKGFLARSEGKILAWCPVVDYAWPGVKNEKAGTSMAGVFGTLIVFGFGYGTAFLLKRPKKAQKRMS